MSWTSVHPSYSAGRPNSFFQPVFVLVCSFLSAMGLLLPSSTSISIFAFNLPNVVALVIYISNFNCDWCRNDCNV